MFAVVLRLFTFFLVCSTSGDLKRITAKPGDDVVLRCQGSDHGAVDLLQWSRSDLESDYVFYYRDGLEYDDYQHQAFHGRVELKDPQMKDGDASVILRNVSNGDAGTYECRVMTGIARSVRTDASDVTSSVLLTVDDTGGASGLTPGLIVLAVILVLVAAAVGFLLYKRKSRAS